LVREIIEGMFGTQGRWSRVKSRSEAVLKLEPACKAGVFGFNHLMPPHRQLGLVSALALVVASMIGSGVFTTSGFLLADLYSPGRVLAVWLCGGALALLGALCYGALARQFPESGGEYLFLARTLHPGAGYVAGWVSLLVGFSAPLAAVSLAFGEYTKGWFPFSTPVATGSGLLLILAATHAFHVQRGAWIQNVAVLAKLLLIAALLGWGGTHLHLSAPAPSGGQEKASAFSLASFAVALVWVSFSYSGWNAAVYIGSEVRAPERNLPRALAVGSGLVAVIYLALNAVFVYAAPVTQLAGKLEIGQIAGEALGGRPFANFVTALIALALATASSAMMMSGPRVYARMADDGCLPRWFGFPAQGPPRRAILLQSALALIMLWTATFQSLLTYIGFTLGLSTAAAVAGLIRLRLREGPQVNVPGWPWAPAIFVLSAAGTTGFTIAQRPAESAVGLGTLLVGWVAWRIGWGKRAG
jgi:APA family basic amino acid/polyamine antiporter